MKTVWARLPVDGAMAVEGTFEAYAGDEEVEGAEGGEGAPDWDARAYAGHSGSPVRPVPDPARARSIWSPPCPGPVRSATGSG